REPVGGPGDAGVRERIAVAPQVRSLRKPRQQTARGGEDVAVVGIGTHEQHGLVQALDFARGAQAGSLELLQRDPFARRKRRAEAILDPFQAVQRALRHVMFRASGSGSYWARASTSWARAREVVKYARGEAGVIGGELPMQDKVALVTGAGSGIGR